MFQKRATTFANKTLNFTGTKLTFTNCGTVHAFQLATRVGQNREDTVAARVTILPCKKKELSRLGRLLCRGPIVPLYFLFYFYRSTRSTSNCGMWHQLKYCISTLEQVKLSHFHPWYWIWNSTRLYIFLNTNKSSILNPIFPSWIFINNSSSN